MAKAKFIPERRPPGGGSYTRDPETGELTRNQPTEPAAAPPEQQRDDDDQPDEET